MTFVNNLNEIKDKLKILEESQNIGGRNLSSFKSLLNKSEQNKINMLIEKPNENFIRAPPDSDLSNRQLYVKHLLNQLITLKQDIINDTIQTSESIANSLSGYQNLLNRTENLNNQINDLTPNKMTSEGGLEDSKHFYTKEFYNLFGKIFSIGILLYVIKYNGINKK